MKEHKHIKASNTLPARYYLLLMLLVVGMFGTLLIPSCTKSQPKEGNIISKGAQHEGQN